MKFKIIIFLLLVTTIKAQNHIEYFENGNKKSEGFKNKEGVMFGNWTFYRQDGSLDAKINFNTYGKPEGKFILFYKNAQTQTRGSYSGQGFYQMDGEYEDYFKNGQLQSKGKYKNNKPIGRWENYWRNGEIKSYEKYTDDGIIQKNTEYYKNGKLRQKTRYNRQGDIRGKYVIYYDSGKIFQIGYYDKNGNKKGVYKSYYPNGQLNQIGEYAGTDYFTKIGIWMSYYSNGKVKSKIIYDIEGKIMDKQFFNKKGSQIEK